MRPRDWCLITVLGTAAARLDAAEQVLLREVQRPGDAAVVSIEFTAAGVGQAPLNEQKGIEHKFSARGRIAFEEKPLATAGGERRRALRYYTQAAVESNVDKQKTLLDLRDPVRLIVAEQRQARRFLFSPAGPLTSEEQQLVEAEGSLDPLTLGRLLPPDPVGPGDKWKPDKATLTAVFNLVDVTSNDLEARLEEVDASTARLKLAGKMEGSVAGTQTKLEIAGRLVFDRKRSRIVRVDLSQKEQRLPGPIGPGLKVDATFTIIRDPDAAVEHLNDSDIGKLPLEPNDATEQLVYPHPDGRFRFYFPRGWRLFYSDRRTVALRLIEKNELVAQCNVTAAPTVAAGSHMPPAEFRSQVQQALGQQFQRFVQEGEVPAPKGHWVYRLAAAGTAGGQPVVWYYYLAAGPQGQQLVFTFTLDANLAERFGPQDMSLVGTLEFDSSRTASSSK